jgi:phage terminase large subunit-like protein
VSIADFNRLTEAEQNLVAERLLKIAESGWKPFWCRDPHCDGLPHQLLDDDGRGLWVDQSENAGPEGEPVGIVVEFDDGARLRPLLDEKWAHNHARADQRLPPWAEPWTLFIMSGRGAGKTTTGVEFVTLCARKGLDGAIVGRRGTELENTHVATLLARAHPEFVPEYQSSKDRIVWPNGAITYLFSAERPENIRSVNLSYVWFDEAAHMDEVEKAWTNAKFAARVKSPGNPIHMLITSTPTPTPWVMKMEDDPKVEVRRVSTYANRANLDAEFIADLEADYEGTRIGRQELHGEVLRDVEGALWNDGLFRHLRVDEQEFQDLIDSMDDRVLAVDPAGSKGPRSDAHGIISVGSQHFDENDDPLPASTFYVLGDATLKGTPSDRSAQTFKAARMFRVNRIVVEKNFGGEDVKQGLQDYAKLNPEEACDENGEAYKIDLVHAVKSKETRAEPTVGKYEQGRVTHVTSPTVFGDLSELEKEQVGWVPKSRGGRMPSPNRIDALVWAMRALESKVKYAAQQATSKEVMKKLKRTV